MRFSKTTIFSFLRQFFVIFFITAVLLESGSYFYIRYINSTIPLPTYSFVNAGSDFWVYLNEHFGVWHAPHSSYLHNKSCFVVEYQANSLGMRDKERTTRKQTDKRVVLLGDSFIEGWGNVREDRLSDRLERRLGQEVLNFGTSGGFGTIQEWLQYKHFVKNFEHDVVMIGILPQNDFQDNSYEYALTKNRVYKPLLLGEYPDYRLVYYKEKLPGEDDELPILKSFDFTLREWSSIYRVMRFLGSYRLRDFSLKPRWLAEHQDNPEYFESKYYDFTQEEWNIMKYSIEQIFLETSDRKLIVFTIPSHQDFLRYEGEKAPLTINFEALSAELGFQYVDLLPAMEAMGLDATDIFFVCDDHWSPYGNKVAADILEPYARAAVSKQSH